MKKNIKILNVVGARPNFIKIAPITKAIKEHNQRSRNLQIESPIVHTGQHYDEKMSRLFFEELNIPKPDYNLEVGSGSHAYQTAEIMKRFEPVVIKEKPDYVLVVGDVNSTVACALVAKKLGIRVIHVEAGLRSFDMTMPEEINRKLTDAISDILFITEKSAEKNLIREGIAKEKIHFVGNVMIDTLNAHKEKAQKSDILHKLGLTNSHFNIVDEKSINNHLTLTDYNLQLRPYALLTLHRPSNVDDLSTLNNIFEAISEISEYIRVIFPAHPRTRNQMKKFRINQNDSIKAIDPLGYLDFLKLMANARFMMTDSGGIQEETTVLGIPCLTLRNNTERPVTVEVGTNVIVGMDKNKIIKESKKILNGSYKKGDLPELWDGMAAGRIIKILSSKFK